MSKHTKGPWRVGDAGHAVFGPPGSGMSPNAPITIVSRLANKGNAALIAAAPELLQELRNAKLMLELNLPDTHPMLIRINEAIAKAEGGEK